MKKMSKLFSLALATILSLCLCSFGLTWQVGADASVNTIVITNSNSAVSISGITYSAYKVFAATVDNPGTDNAAYSYTLDENCLGGTAGYATVLNNASFTPTGITNDPLSRQFADALYNYYIKGKEYSNIICHKAQGTVAEGAETVTLTITNPGYYLVVGTVKSKDAVASKDVVTSLAMLDTVSDKEGVDMAPKADVPTIGTDGKKIKTGENTYSQLADNQIGDTIEYKIDVQLPKSYANNYGEYKYKIEDTISAGLTFDETTGSIVLKNTTKNTTIDASKYTVAYSNNKKTMTLTIDIKALMNESTPVVALGDKLTLTYKAIINENAAYVINADTEPANANQVKLMYSNDPYTSNSFAETPDYIAYDYTFGLEVDKVKKGTSSNSPLKGASFQIFTDNSGNNRLDFVKVSDDSDNIPVYRVAKAGDTGTIVTEGILTGSVKSGYEGKFKVYGFDGDKTYYIKEKEAPDGYAKLDDYIPFTIHPEYTDSTVGADNITNLTFSDTSNATSKPWSYSTSGDLILTIENTAGSELVGTGGIGTTIFYVGGGILMVGAAVLLVTKLRMRNK